jgi:hypothetical protein
MAVPVAAWLSGCSADPTCYDLQNCEIPKPLGDASDAAFDSLEVSDASGTDGAHADQSVGAPADAIDESAVDSAPDTLLGIPNDTSVLDAPISSNPPDSSMDVTPFVDGVTMDAAQSSDGPAEAACVNGTTQSCPGICGALTCASGAWGSCVQPTFAPGELHWPMPNTPGLPNPPQYDTSTAGVVVDKVTGLTWQQPISAATYTQAQAVSYCASLGAGWRLPTRIELTSLIDFTVVIPPQTNSTIDATAFPGTPLAPFWTSSAAVGNPGFFWDVDFSNAGTGFSSGMARARCVR